MRGSNCKDGKRTLQITLGLRESIHLKDRVGRKGSQVSLRFCWKRCDCQSLKSLLVYVSGQAGTNTIAGQGR